MNARESLAGLVIASFGRHHLVEAGSAQYQCVTRSKQASLTCGDQVMFLPTGVAQGVIERILPRTNLLYRSVAHRSKLIAANVGQVVIVVAPVPSFYELLLNRCLIAAEAADIPAIVCINKADLGQPADQVRQALTAYEKLGYRIVSVSAHHDIGALAPLLQDRISVFVGQSGMGKSSLINALIPDANTATGEISTALDSGRHTTTGARMYRLNNSSRLVDSPGMQVFGLKHLQARELDQLFVEFRPYIGHCRFDNCMHRNEPGCAIRTACDAGAISAARMEAYLDILGELDS